MKGMIVTRPHRCLGCKACEIACALEHSRSRDLYQAMCESPAPSSRVEVAQGEAFVVPLQCRQCEDAPCATVCPKSALSRADMESPIVLDHDLCIGCQWCVLACPFGLITLDENSKTIIKCDQCSERLKRGELPACVSACPTGALEFESSDKVVADTREKFLVRIERGLDGDDE